MSMRNRLWALALLVLLALIPQTLFAASLPAVVSGHPLATAAGLEVLAVGGNATDGAGAVRPATIESSIRR